MTKNLIVRVPPQEYEIKENGIGIHSLNTFTRRHIDNVLILHMEKHLGKQ